MNGFKVAIDSYGLHELGQSNYPFTQSNNRSEIHNGQCHLDWFLANTKWVNIWNGMRVTQLTAPHSDRVPILHVTEEEEMQREEREKEH